MRDSSVLAGRDPDPDPDPDPGPDPDQRLPGQLHHAPCQIVKPETPVTPIIPVTPVEPVDPVKPVKSKYSNHPSLPLPPGPGQQGQRAEDLGRGDCAQRHRTDLCGRHGRLQAQQDPLNHPQVRRLCDCDRFRNCIRRTVRVRF